MVPHGIDSREQLSIHRLLLVADLGNLNFPFSGEAGRSTVESLETRRSYRPFRRRALCH